MHVVLGGGAGGGKRRGKHGEYTGSGWQECAGKRNDFLETKEREKGTREPARTSVVDLCVTACPRHNVATSPPHPPRNGVFWEIGEKAETDPRSQGEALGVLAVRYAHSPPAHRRHRNGRSMGRQKADPAAPNLEWRERP